MEIRLSEIIGYEMKRSSGFSSGKSHARLHILRRIIVPDTADMKRMNIIAGEFFFLPVLLLWMPE